MCILSLFAANALNLFCSSCPLRAFVLFVVKIGRQFVTGIRLWTMRKRLATKALSHNVALPAGLAPETWKSLNAAAWFTQIEPVRLHESGTPASAAASSAFSMTFESVE